MKWLVLAVLCMLPSFSFCHHLHLVEKDSLWLNEAVAAISYFHTYILFSPNFLVRVAAMFEKRWTEDPQKNNARAFFPRGCMYNLYCISTNKPTRQGHVFHFHLYSQPELIQNTLFLRIIRRKGDWGRCILWTLWLQAVIRERERKKLSRLWLP